MIHTNFNEELRKIFNSFVDDNFNIRSISGLTFGLGKSHRLNLFLEGGDLSLKPLIPMFEEFGFELHVVPILKSDPTSKKQINKITDDNLYVFKVMVLEALERIKSNKQSQFDKFIKKKISQLKGENHKNDKSQPELE